eukprot:gene11664-4901_t
MYKNKVILAPMVRVGRLPFRLLALDYGADLVYSEELIDKKLLQTVRKYNKELDLVEYVQENTGYIVYQTCPKEKGKNVLQLGTGTPELALKSALHCYEDYSAIDINMGCPLHFSTHSKMGSELLKDPQRIKEILTTLVNNIDKPVTCKIRIFPDEKETIELVQMIEKTGVAAIGVHARYIPDRPRDPARLERLAAISESISIPVIANGDVFNFSDIQEVQKITKCPSVMIARGALWNCSIFQKEKEDDYMVAQKYLMHCLNYNEVFSYTKYTLQKMYEKNPKDIVFQDIVKAKTFESLTKIFDIEKKI